MARKTKEDTEKTRQALLDAACLVFSEQGVANTTLNNIASAAGMTRGAVYWHFPNKDAVIQALWERDAGAHHSEFVESMQNPALTLEEFVELLHATLFKALTDTHLTQSLRVVLSSQELMQQSSELQHFLRKRRHQLYQALRTALERLQQEKQLRTDISLTLLTNSLWAYLTGLLHTHLEANHISLMAADSHQLMGLWLDATRAS